MKKDLETSRKEQLEELLPSQKQNIEDSKIIPLALDTSHLKDWSEEQFRAFCEAIINVNITTLDLSAEKLQTKQNKWDDFSKALNETPTTRSGEIEKEPDVTEQPSSISAGKK